MKKKRLWSLDVTEVLELLATDRTHGLTRKEAAIRLQKYGLNVLAEPVKITPLKILLRQFLNGIIFVLIGALAIAFFLGAFVDMVALATIVVFNAIIGFVQEYGAEKSLEALRRLTKPTARVVRDGESLQEESLKLVPGDIVILEAGDVVPADGRLIESHELTTDESSLTGESVPVLKNTSKLPQGDYVVGDLTNMVFMATVVVKGRGRIVVTQTGAQTQYGEIAEYIVKSPEGRTQLEEQLKKVGSILIAISCGSAATIALLGFVQGTPAISLMYMALSLFIAAVPEGLPAVITVSLARAVKRMARKNALIRRLASVEALGSISIICTDKTGTITQNRMVVRKLYAGDRTYEVTGIGIEPHGDFIEQGTTSNPQKIEHDLSMALQIGVLCNGADLIRTDQGWTMRGDPTEGALLTAAAKAGYTKAVLEETYPLIQEHPFDSERKLMSILRHTASGACLYVKGAGNAVLDCSHSILKNGAVIPLSDQERTHLISLNDEFASQALRVLAVAYREGSKSEFIGTNADEKNLVFVGFFAMIDPPRPEVRDAILMAHKAGIKTIMLTGDHVETARAIGKTVGLIKDDHDILSGDVITKMTDVELLEALSSTSVCARISVEHKIRIVSVLKRSGERVAMTGDGVNDAPALKAADIGIAMGITGTDVAKEASDMIITDDNYASIVLAIQEGRGMYEALLKFVRYLLSSNLAEVFVVLWGALYSCMFPAPADSVTLLPIQLLWINMVSDGLPAMALVFDPLHPNLMQKSPHEFAKSLVSSRSLGHLFGVGIILSLGVFFAYIYGLQFSVATGQTMAFTTLVLLEFVRLSSVRNEFGLSLFSNPLLIVAVLASLFLQGLVLYIPAFQKVFSTVPLTMHHWLIMVASVFVTWFINRLFQKLFP